MTQLTERSPHLGRTRIRQIKPPDDWEERGREKSQCPPELAPKSSAVSKGGLRVSQGRRFLHFYCALLQAVPLLVCGEQPVHPPLLAALCFPHNTADLRWSSLSCNNATLSSYASSLPITMSSTPACHHHSSPHNPPHWNRGCMICVVGADQGHIATAPNRP